MYVQLLCPCTPCVGLISTFDLQNIRTGSTCNELLNNYIPHATLAVPE